MGLWSIIIDREAGEIMRLVVSMCLCVCIDKIGVIGVKMFEQQDKEARESAQEDVGSQVILIRDSNYAC